MVEADLPGRRWSPAIVSIGGSCAADGTVTLAAGDIKTCVVVNQAVLWTLVEGLGLNYLLAAVLSAQAAITTNFALVSSGPTSSCLGSPRSQRRPVRARRARWCTRAPYNLMGTCSMSGRLAGYSAVTSSHAG